MRLAVTLVQDAQGKWGALHMPPTTVEEQKAARKAIIKDGGKLKGKQVRHLILLTTRGEVKRSSFLQSDDPVYRAAVAARDKANATAHKRQNEMKRDPAAFAKKRAAEAKRAAAARSGRPAAEPKQGEQEKPAKASAE